MNSSARFFDSFADRFDELYDGKRNPFMRWMDRNFRRDMFIRFEMTFDALGDLEGKRILDVGCGSGPYVAEALRRGAQHVTGVDPAPRMLELAKQRVTELSLIERSTLLQGYFPEVSPQGPFDFAIVMGVMDYVENALEFVQSLRDVVSGGAVLSFPSTHWFRTPFRRVRYRMRRCPVYFYTSEQIERLLQKALVSDSSVAKIRGAGMDYFVCFNL